MRCYSALTKAPLPQDVAVTGEVSLAGNVRAVGGVVEKLYAARQAGMRAIVLPKENTREIDAASDGIEVIAVSTVVEALAALGVRVPVPPAERAAAGEGHPVNVAHINHAVDRIPPNDLEAEMALLGSILVDKEMMATVSEIVGPGDFYAPLHESIFVALYALYERGEPLDKVALAEELRNRGMLDKVGGLAYLTR